MTHKPVKLLRHGEYEPVTAYLLHYKVEDDVGRFFSGYYTQKRPTPSKRKEVTAVYWIPCHPLPLTMSEKEDLTRGKTFFTRREGFLFGAVVSLSKSGNLFRRRLV